MPSMLSDYFTLDYIGLTLGVLSGLFSIYTYVRTRERRNMSYKITDETIVGGHSPVMLDNRVEIRFDDMVIDRVTRTTLWIWNSGNRTINSSDIALNDRISIALPEGTQILQLTTMSKVSANAVRVDLLTSSGVFPTFDFLDPNQGFKCEILHTAAENTVSLNGTLKGIGKMKSDRSGFFDTLLSAIPNTFMSLVTMIVIIGVSEFITSPIPDSNEAIRSLVFIGLIIIMAGVFFAFFDRFQTKRWRSKPPYSLNE
ncbi:hypothetical protein RMR21_015595 [Agrobacterium sp. rho-8.1]|nr:hypothetical protein [Agrobacterium sp. rho-8.1]